MEIYRSFVVRLVRNYVMGSVAALVMIGTVMMVSTLQFPKAQLMHLIVIVAISLLSMTGFEWLALKRQLRPIRRFFAAKRTDRAELNGIYERIHRLPEQAAYRILGPHLFG
ncbi:TPA: hypothetical protein ACG3KH_004292, partial [Clostridioides difficile]